MHKSTPALRGERRAHVRYAHALRTSCRLLGREAGAPWTARVADVSRAGAVLLMRCEVRPSAVLVAALQGVGGRFSRPLLLRVMNVRPQGDGCWHVGCAFVRPLSEDDVQALLLVPPSA
jgi:hypothetical protein